MRKASRDIQMVILFGSYARGDWVGLDLTYDEHRTFAYRSDYDLLVVTRLRKTVSDYRLWEDIQEQIHRTGIKTPVTIIPYCIKDLNSRLSNAHYFYTDIVKEGTRLYNSQQCRLRRPEYPNPKQVLKAAQQDYRVWLKSATASLDHYEFAVSKRSYRWAAFHLHQATEHAYNAISLVFTGYKPKLHNLDQFDKQLAVFVPDIAGVFPRETKQQQRLLSLLNKAYVDARYKRTYKITKKELEILAESIRRLHKLTRKLCRKRIEEFKKHIDH
jgi:HEPN domain-containing protein